MEKEYLCMLHSSIGCDSRGYRDSQCVLERKAKFASCPYRRVAVVLPDESPKIVAPPPQQETLSDFVDGVDQ